METFGYIALCAVVIWAIVELVKHITPTAYDRYQQGVETWAHDRINGLHKRVIELENKIEGGK